MTDKNRRDSEPGRPTAGRKPAHVDHPPESGGPLPSQSSGPARPPAAADPDEPTAVPAPAPAGTPGGPLPADPPDDDATVEHRQPSLDGPTQRIKPPLDGPTQRIEPTLDGPTQRLVPPLDGPTRRIVPPLDGPTPRRQQQADDPTPAAPVPVHDLDGPTRRLRPSPTESDPAGAEPRDGDPEPRDGNPEGQNAGPEPQDAGPEPQDAGAEPQDAGAQPQDAGAEPRDAARTGTAGERAAAPEPAESSLERVMPGDGAEGVPAEDREPAAAAARTAPWRRISSPGVLIWVLLALLGFTLVVQLRSNDGDDGLATTRQDDLVRILSDLESRDSRLQSEIAALELSQRQLSSGVGDREAALADADKRADELGLLAGTLRGRGPGLRIVMSRVKASAVLNAVQELRGAGGEVMQLGGLDGTAVRIVASSYFVDADGGGLLVDGVRLSGPYVLEVIGSPSIMQTALQIHGGVVESVNSGGGSVTMEQRSMVEVTALRKATTLQYARPVS